MNSIFDEIRYGVTHLVESDMVILDYILGLSIKHHDTILGYTFFSADEKTSAALSIFYLVFLFAMCIDAIKSHGWHLLLICYIFFLCIILKIEKK